VIPDGRGGTDNPRCGGVSTVFTGGGPDNGITEGRKADFEPSVDMDDEGGENFSVNRVGQNYSHLVEDEVEKSYCGENSGTLGGIYPSSPHPGQRGLGGK